MQTEFWRQVEELFEAAQALPPGERARLLEGADPNLRSEVQSLLDAAPGARSFLEGTPISSVSERPYLLAAGRTLGSFEILSPIGRGGMGEVYRARDLRLKREVAVKVLAGEVTDAERKRFLREAQAASALNHPNIVTIHEVGEQDGLSYIAMEYVAGKTLSALIPSRGMRLNKALELAAQLAGALAVAHSAGIVHRDLKPGNVMVTESGTVKVLDFGLAKRSQTSTRDEATRTIEPDTETGTVLGTVGYMSPEQAEGRAVDTRSDIFSFGSILYEMLSGKRAFRGDSQMSTLAAIIRDEPQPLIAGIPAELRKIVARCLVKDRERRYQHIGDVKLALQEVGEPGSDTPDTEAPPASAPRRIKAWHIAAASALFLIAGLIAGGLYLGPPSLPDQAAYRFTPFAFDSNPCCAWWSPNAKAVAYCAEESDGTSQVFVRYLDSSVPTQVTHRPGDGIPFAWSPDSERILFASNRKPGGVWSIAAAGGEPEPMLAIPPNSLGNTLTASPDLTAIAILHAGDDGRWGVWISAPIGSELKKYSPDPFASRDVGSTGLRFSPDGKNLLLFNLGEQGRQEGWLLPYPPDPSSPPHRVLDRLIALSGTARFDWLPDSRRIVVSTPSNEGQTSQLWMADTMTGRYHALTAGTTNSITPAVSPDGTKILYLDFAIDFDVVSADLATARVEPVIATDRNERLPNWAAKQPVLAYTTDRNGRDEIWVRSLGTDRPVVTAKDFPPGTTRSLSAPSLSPDALRVIYSRADTRGSSRLWISAVSGGIPTPLTKDQPGMLQHWGSWSPDGIWFAYEEERNGRTNLMKAKTTGRATPIPIYEKAEFWEHNVAPCWSPDGKWISFGERLFSPDGQMTRSLPKAGSSYYMFSADSRRVYGIREDGTRHLLFFVDLATGQQEVVGDLGRGNGPRPEDAITLSLAPDGKSFVYEIAKEKNNLWVLEGFESKLGLLGRLGLVR